MNVMGLDLSLSAAGFVAVPSDWHGDWSRIARHHVGHSLPRDATELRRVGRLHQITSEGIMFAKRHGCSAAVFEHYAFGTKFERERLGEVGGAMKLGLVAQAGIVDFESKPASTARKLLMGACPAKDAKAHVREHLLGLGMPRVWTDDEMDAFVMANWWLSEHGGFALATPAPVKERRRKAA